jgi:HTH-type transcriptional regulator/antitoxin MqsA
MIVAKDEKSLPETMVEPETGAILSRGVRPFTVTYKGESLTA